MTERRTYRLAGMFWRQDPLTYDQFVQVWSLLRRRREVGEKGDPLEIFSAWMDMLLEDNVLPQLLNIILKPHEPTPLHRWWNDRQRRRLNLEKGKEAGAVIQATPDFGMVVRDFFVINVAWIDGWLNTSGSSGSSKRPTPAATLSTLIRIASSLQAATSSGRQPSEPSMQKPSSAGAP